MIRVSEIAREKILQTLNRLRTFNLNGLLIAALVDLSGDFGVWAVSDEAAFLKGRMAWVNWDITELKEKKDEIINDNLFIVSLSGWPFNE